MLNSDLVKDGLSCTDNCDDVVKTEITRLATVHPTMWIGAQNGWSVCSVDVEHLPTVINYVINLNTPVELFFEDKNNSLVVFRLCNCDMRNCVCAAFQYKIT